MKLQHLKRTVETSGIGETSSFRLSNDPRAVQKLMDLLSNSLYSNKIGSMVRELSCNAYDAHVAAGRKDVPFYIHLPDSMEPWFTVQDFGTGLSPDDIENIYQVYGASTKDDCNDVVGAFGLGSKTPLAYTDAFTVTSNFEGMQYVYSVFIDDTNTPSTTLIASMETTEHNGMTIQVPVQRDDYHRFRSEVFAQLRYFDMPITLGNTTEKFEPRKYVDDYESSNFRLHSIQQTHGETHYYTRAEFNVVQGPVGYPVSTDDLTREFAKFEETDKGNFNKVRAALQVFRMMGAVVDIFCSIGDIQVVPSRESISLSPFTVRNLFAKMVLVADDILVHFVKKTATLPTLNEWEKACYKKELDYCGYVAYHFGLDAITDIAPDYSNSRKAILEAYKDGVELLDCQATSYTWTRHSPLAQATSPDPFTLYPRNTEYFFFWMDAEPQPRLLTRIREYIDKIGDVHSNTRVIVFRGVNGTDYLQKKLPGAPALVKVSSIPETDAYLQMKTDRAAAGLGERNASVFGYRFDSVIDFLAAAGGNAMRSEFNATPFMTRVEFNELLETSSLSKRIVAVPYNTNRATADNQIINIDGRAWYGNELLETAHSILSTMESCFSAEFDESDYIFVGMSQTAYDKAENLYTLEQLYTDVKRFAFDSIPDKVVNAIKTSEQIDKHLKGHAWFASRYAEALARVCPQVGWVVDKLAEVKNLNAYLHSYSQRQVMIKLINEFSPQDLSIGALGGEGALLVERANIVQANHKGLYPIIDTLEDAGVLNRYAYGMDAIMITEDSDPEYFKLRYDNAVQVLGFDPIKEAEEAADAEENEDENNAANDEVNDCALAA